MAFDELYGTPTDIGQFTDTGMTDPDVGRQTFVAVLHEVAILALLAVWWTGHSLIKLRTRSPGTYCHFVMIRTRRWAAVVGIGLIMIMAAASAATVDTTRRDADGAPSAIKVGIKPLDPFVTKNGDQYHGFSIDLWNEIARRNSRQTSYVWHDTLPSLLRDVQTTTVDVGTAGITITKDREQVLDFSYPMFDAGLEVMTTPRCAFCQSASGRSRASISLCHTAS